MLTAVEPSSACPASADHACALDEGQRLAAFTGRPAGGADILIGMLRAGGASARLLLERGIIAPKLEAVLPRVKLEADFSVAAVDRASHEIAASLHARQTSSLHLLLAILRAGGSAAETLRLAGHDPAKVRAIVMRALTGPGRNTERATRRQVGEAPPTPRRVATTSISPPRTAPPQAPARSQPSASTSQRAPAPPAALTLPRVEVRVTPAVPVPRAEVAPTAAAESDLLPLEPPRSPVLHRDRELGRLLDLLQVRNPSQIIAIIGDPGSGRTALLAALSAASGEKPLAPAEGPPGDRSPGTWLEDLHRRAPPTAPLALDGASVLGGDNSDGPAHLIGTARAGRRWILTATPADLRRLEATAPDLAASLETVVLSPLGPDVLFEVIETGLDSLMEATGIQFGPDSCKALVRMAPRYPSERAQPGRSLAIAEITAARVARLGRRRVTEADIADVVAAAADVPVARLLRTDDERFRTLETRLAERVVGHEDARAKIANVLRRSYAGFRGRRPLASLLLLGPTGVGKTETARAIADALFDGEAALLRIDLSEYNEPHAAARLIGSPPGYVGYEEGGQLTEAIRRRPASVVLLDELEKAHREVQLLLLQVLEDGRLTDGRGRTVDFSAAAIVMTSNLGSECYRRSRTPAVSTISGIARSRLPPELWNRIDEVLCYAPLQDVELRSILGRIASESSRRLEAERGIQFSVDSSVIDTVLAAEPDRSLGARPLRRTFERLVEGPLATEILAGNLRRGARLDLSCGPSGQLAMVYGR